MMPLRRRSTIWRLLVIALLLLPVLAACGSTPQTTLEPQSERADQIYDLFKIFFWAGIAVFVVVETILVLVIIRFRERKRKDGLASEMHGNTKLEIAWTIAPAVLVAFLATATYQTQAKVQREPENPLIITAIGHQWWWEFNYDAPLAELHTANELYVPQGREIKVLLESADVIHSFWVPRLMGKTDMLPGHTNRLYFNARDVGTYEAQCAEFCGEQHAVMRFKVVVLPAAEFDAWAAAMKTPAAEPPASFAICFSCHVVNAEQNNPRAPNLRNFGDRGTIAAGALPLSPENLARWLHNPEEVKSGNFMTTVIKPAIGDQPATLNETQVNELVQYLMGLKVR
jgi:cytochrome c oxidase subunit 2